MDIVIGRMYVRTLLYKEFGGKEADHTFVGQLVKITDIRDGVVFFKKQYRFRKELDVKSYLGIGEFIQHFSPVKPRMQENE